MPLLLYTLAFALVASLVLWRLVKPAKVTKLDIPYVDFVDGKKSMKRYQHETNEIMERGYNEYLKKDLPFSMFNYLDASTPMVVLPLKYLSQVRSASTSKLSFTSFLNKVSALRTA